MTKYSFNDKKWNNLVQDHKTIAELGIDVPFGMIGAGRYNAADPTLDEGDFGFLRVTVDGKLMVDTELTLDGSVIINNLGGAAAKDAAIAGNPVQIGIEAADFDGAALPGAVGAEGDVTYPKGSLSGVQYFMPVNENGSLTTLYAEDAAHTSGEGGTFILAVRNDAQTTLVDTDGDYAPLQVDSDGMLGVSISNVTYAEDSAHTTADEGLFTLAVRQDTLATSVDTDGDYGALKFNAKGSQYVDVSSVLGSDMSVTNGAFTVITDNTTAVQVNTAFAETEAAAQASLFTTGLVHGWNNAGSNLMALEVNADNAATDGTPNVLEVGGLYKATLDTYADNDAVPFHFDVNGRLITAVELNDYVDDAAFTVTTDKLLVVGGVATADSVDANDAGAFRMTTARNLGIDVTTKDGAAWAVGNAINATIGDGTTVPVVETAGTKKALNVNVTDGTNDMPTMDAVGRAGYVYVTDGTNTQPTGDAVARRIFVTHNNGTQEMPSGDAVGRSIYTAVGDGTTTATVNTAFAITEAGAQASLFTTGLTMGWNNAGSSLSAIEVNVDNAATSGTPNVLNVGGVYKSTLDTYADNDASPLHTNVNGELLSQIKGYDTGTDSNKVFEVNPISEHHVKETLAGVTNGADGTYNYYIDMDGYKFFSLDMDISGGSGTCTIKVYASNQDDGTAVGSIGLWHDVTNDWFGAASFTADDYLEKDTPISAKYLKIEVVAATGAADDADWDLYAKKMY